MISMARTATLNRRPKARSNKPLLDVAEVITDKMIAKLEAGTIPWQRSWSSKDGGGGIPLRMSTGHPYRGVNVFLLQLAGLEYGSPWWGTYKQISERGGQVRKGEHNTLVVFWKLLRKEEQVEGKTVTKRIPLLRQYGVFNLEQADWPEGSKKPGGNEPVLVAEDPVAAAEALVAEYLATGPALHHGGNQAFYRPATDSVQLPAFASFRSAAEYHSTLFHELTHSTGHDSRLKRDGIADGTFGPFGSEVYSNEELVAEMGAAILCALAGIEQEAVFNNSAAYIATWLRKLQSDHNLVIRAAAAAQRAVDLVVGTTFANDEEEA
jgi:antirestriction protein ArdC